MRKGGVKTIIDLDLPTLLFSLFNKEDFTRERYIIHSARREKER